MLFSEIGSEKPGDGIADAVFLQIACLEPFIIYDKITQEGSLDRKGGRYMMRGAETETPAGAFREKLDQSEYAALWEHFTDGELAMGKSIRQRMHLPLRCRKHDGISVGSNRSNLAKFRTNRKHKIITYSYKETKKE